MDIALIIIFVILLVVFRALKVGDYFSPWTLTIGVWLAILVMFQFESGILYPLGPKFYTSLCLWVPIFTVSSLVTYYFLPGVARPATAIVSDFKCNMTIFDVLFYISMIISPLYLWQILKIVTMFDTQDLLYNLRILSVSKTQQLGFLSYASIINQSLFIVAVWKFPKIPLWKLLCIVVASFMCAFAIMEKGGIFFMFLSTIFVLFEKKVIKPRTIAIAGAVLIVLFYLMNAAREVQSDKNAESMTFVDFFAIYILSPAVAYEKVARDISTQIGSHTFETLYLFLARFGYQVEVNDKLQEFVWVPLPTNVYTIFQPFYQDFGQRGVAFFALVYGFFSGLSYRAFTNGSGFGKCIYSYIVYALVLQFYQENIFLSIVAVIQFSFFTFIIAQDVFRAEFFVSNKEIADNNQSSSTSPEQ
ncbi:O-antigen polymerase [Prevotella lacticifex]|uniref:O-antigen polymerase n=1 Tax=Prevotella lacticifex TaxID=2854755 RepID=A0A9R1C9H0_9BACT|nr:O-antigen polymerase [Prevotella lacticifex]GJG35240.1 O-antigen polymerase [Prevotella lacticifex]GJG39709.1 O-antigen polymerase [Prevotella lacticifex]GJG41609.1 O-antigen polymerase [Prevotella lacticifex]GJG46065.1 O-antigen polymerase [Prevotella lacticifex]GJG47960.1 O-antigen polymerase [Prevotella lacticifex]